MKIALQLYTVRNEMQEAFEATLEEVAAIGYRHVELPHLFGRDAEEFRRRCDHLNLSIASLMTSLDSIIDSVEDVARTSQILGNRYVVVPSIPPELQTNYSSVARALVGSGRALAERGLRLCYHNHAFEFIALAGAERGYDTLCREAFGPSVMAELDVYWVWHSGLDPKAIMDLLVGLLPLLHIKDVSPGPTPTFAEVGTGVLAIDELIRQAADSGTEYLVVEQDGSWHDSALASARVSYDNLTRSLQTVLQAS